MTATLIDPASIRLATAMQEAAEAATNTGVVYLLHFDRPYRHAGHYTGWTTNLLGRIEAHETGHGARLLAVIRQAGIGFTLARTWDGDRRKERRLKMSKLFVPPGSALNRV